jgi:NAD+ synthetase
MIDYSKFVENSRKWLSQYIKDNHLQSICVGVSGGVDSTVSCAIASPVCKELNIPLIGRSLPTTTNKIEESRTAQLVGEAFCDDFKTVNISEECQKLIHELELVEGKMTRLQEGNVKARVRMIYLRHLASVHKGVVLDNDNFTEWNLGFWTVGGDSPMDINLGLHYLWKTEIYELAKYLIEEFTEQAVNIYPSDINKEASLDKKVTALLKSMKLIPTDGNGVSNSDCEQFGLDNYEQVDDVLKTVYYNHYPNSIRALSEADFNKEYTRLIDSYNEQGVDKVMILHQNTKYKRKELPIKPTKEDLGLGDLELRGLDL